jgi:glycosyltransferase involved in cell wall biosynthesis
MMISIVIPVYFFNEFVIQMFNSIKYQDFKDYEIIVVGNSISEQEFSKIKFKIDSIFLDIETNLNYIFTSKKGANQSRMLGFENSLGNYVFFMDSDDQFANNKVMSKVNTIIKQYNSDIISINLQHALLKDSNLTPKEIVYNYSGGDKSLVINDDFKIIAENFGTNICARFIKRKLLNNVHFLDLPYCQDWNVSSKIFLKANLFYFISEPSYFWVYRENSISRIDSMSQEKHFLSFNSILDILDFYKINDTNNKYRYFLYDRLIKFCFQYIARSNYFDIKEGFTRSNLLINKEIQFNVDFFRNKRIVIMYLMIKIRILFKFYIFYKPVQK